MFPFTYLDLLDSSPEQFALNFNQAFVRQLETHVLGLVKQRHWPGMEIASKKVSHGPDIRVRFYNIIDA